MFTRRLSALLLGGVLCTGAQAAPLSIFDSVREMPAGVGVFSDLSETAPQSVTDRSWHATVVRTDSDWALVTFDRNRRDGWVKLAELSPELPRIYGKALRALHRDDLMSILVASEKAHIENAPDHDVFLGPFESPYVDSVTGRYHRTNYLASIELALSGLTLPEAKAWVSGFYGDTTGSVWELSDVRIELVEKEQGLFLVYRNS
tara:strand:+ start:757 stop:1368 length:612 start_codon:yes stop_codon:yes gene_type:complete